MCLRHAMLGGRIAGVALFWAELALTGDAALDCPCTSSVVRCSSGSAQPPGSQHAIASRSIWASSAHFRKRLIHCKDVEALKG